MKNDLSHLTPEELCQLKEKYYGNGKVKDLISEYDLNITPSNLYKYFPDEESIEDCIYCKVKMMKPSISKSDMLYSFRANKLYCPSCNHSNEKSCSCKNCLTAISRERENQKNKKFEILSKMIDKKSSETVSIEKATLFEKICLGALLRNCLDEDLITIHPFSNFLNPYAPFDKFENDIIFNLERKGFIKVDLNNSINEYSIYYLNENECQVTSNFQNLYYKINFESEDQSLIDVINSLINPEVDLSIDESLEIWRLIGLNEIYEYMNITCNNLFNIDFHNGPKTELVFKDLLNKFSVGQIFNIIYSRSNYALRIQVEKGIYSRHAANTIIPLVSSYSEKAINGNWTLNNYNRPKNNKESMLSDFFFGRILKIGEKGFTFPPILSSLSFDNEKSDFINPT